MLLLIIGTKPGLGRSYGIGARYSIAKKPRAQGLDRGYTDLRNLTLNLSTPEHMSRLPLQKIRNKDLAAQMRSFYLYTICRNSADLAS